MLLIFCCCGESGDSVVICCCDLLLLLFGDFVESDNLPNPTILDRPTQSPDPTTLMDVNG